MAVGTDDHPTLALLDVEARDDAAVELRRTGVDRDGVALGRIADAGGPLREDERRTLSGVPGLLKLPILSKLLSANHSEISQTDIVMLLTPHILRAPEITEADLQPIYIGSQGNLAIGGPPPLIASQADGPAAGNPSAAGSATASASSGHGPMLQRCWPPLTSSCSPREKRDAR